MALVALLLLPSSAQALPVREGRAAIERYAEKQEGSYAVMWCHHRKARKEVGCWIRWTEVSGLVEGATGWFETAVRANRKRVWEPFFDGP